jgi:hypothetical protein
VIVIREASAVSILHTIPIAIAAAQGVRRSMVVIVVRKE